MSICIVQSMLTIFFCLLSSLLSVQSQGQTCTLDQVIQFAQKNSPEAMRNKTSKENKYWQWKKYKSQYKPQLVLNATLPYYQKQNIPVRQGDGSILYQNIHQSQAYTVLSLEQNIGFTGGTLHLSSDLTRFDDFSQNFTSYSGSPFYLSYNQPLFAFNNLKWMNRIEPLKLEESLKEYVEGNEEIAYNTASRYFDQLVSQINYQIAAANKANADTIFKVGMEKYSMGKISKNELLQLKYGVISAQKSMATASLSIKTSRLELNSYAGMNETDSLIMTLPDSIVRFYIDDSLAVNKSLENSRRSIEFKRERLEARRDAEEIRRESSLKANLSVSYGKTNIAGAVHGIYENPQEMQMFNVGLSIPVLDWGRTKAERKTAEANLKLIEYTLQQDEINFRQEIVTEVENFRMLQEFIEYTAEADRTAAERYEIARLRYQAGDISLTEYYIAQGEKDQAKRDYIIALRDYWLTYYSIRILTLFDFKNHEQLILHSENL
jgi:outer membrane protein